MRATLLLTTLALTTAAHAQWGIQDAHTTASLRGVHSLGNGIAWASGTEGTVLRTDDNGKTWQHCATPPNAEKLDFRGIQAFDMNTAIVMSSGTGDLSRLYKTTDGCKTWKLLFTNPEKEGFFDAISAEAADHAFVLGDSVAQKIQLWEWTERSDPEATLYYGSHGKSDVGEGSFAASNSVLQRSLTPQIDPVWKYDLRWSSGVPNHAYISAVRIEKDACEPCRLEQIRVEVPITNANASSGIFSFLFRDELIGVAVGGDYLKPNESAKTAALTHDGGQHWTASTIHPHGYRSSVAYNAPTKTWITVGPNGTDVSTDDGHNWHPLNPGTGDAPDADKNWNALSLPFVVGPHGRIGILRDGVLAPHK
jgi:photosystem II stability/assembly factor-like uncharacterized protein